LFGLSTYIAITPEPQCLHALSLPTWWIHIASVLEWAAAMVAVQRFGRQRHEPQWQWLSLAMLPALVSAMAACTWHLFDNNAELQGLVVFQATLTALGNAALALATWNLLRLQQGHS
jgi:hypothetical protein